MRKVAHRAIRTLWVLSLGTTLVHCSNRPNSVQSGPVTSSNADREVWWNEQLKQETPAAETVRKDETVKTFEEELKTAPFTGCGYDSLAKGDTHPINPVQLLSTPGQFKDEDVTVFGSGTIQIMGGLSGLQSTNDFTVTSANPNNAEDRAVEFAEKLSAATGYQTITQAEVQTALNKQAADPSCGMMMTKSFRSLSKDGETYINVSLDKPIPYFINPSMSPARIKYDLINPLKFENLIATIDSNDDEVMDQGETRRGRVEVSLLNSSRTVVDSKGQEVTITSEVAFRILNKFETRDGGNETVTLLDQVSDYYITGGKITHVVVLTPKPELPIIVYK